MSTPSANDSAPKDTGIGTTRQFGGRRSGGTSADESVTTAVLLASRWWAGSITRPRRRAPGAPGRPRGPRPPPRARRPPRTHASTSGGAHARAGADQHRDEGGLVAQQARRGRPRARRAASPAPIAVDLGGAHARGELAHLRGVRRRPWPPGRGRPGRPAPAGSDPALHDRTPAGRRRPRGRQALRARDDHDRLGAAGAVQRGGDLAGGGVRRRAAAPRGPRPARARPSPSTSATAAQAAGAAAARAQAGGALGLLAAHVVEAQRRDLPPGPARASAARSGASVWTCTLAWAASPITSRLSPSDSSDASSASRSIAAALHQEAGAVAVARRDVVGRDDARAAARRWAGPPRGPASPAPRPSSRITSAQRARVNDAGLAQHLEQLGRLGDAVAAALQRRVQHRLEVRRAAAASAASAVRRATREHGALHRVAHGGVGRLARRAAAPAPARRRRGRPRRRQRLGGAAHELGQDHPAVAAGAHQGGRAPAAAQRSRPRQPGGGGGRLLHRHGGDEHVRAGVAVGDREDVEVVDLARAGLEGGARRAHHAHQTLARGGGGAAHRRDPTRCAQKRVSWRSGRRPDTPTPSSRSAPGRSPQRPREQRRGRRPDRLGVVDAPRRRSGRG